MNAIEHLKEYEWEHPESYGALESKADPIGDYCVYSRNRDSGCLENSNYEIILKELSRLDSKVYDFRAGHWACGWVEYIIVPKNCNQETLTRAGEFVCSLADYPILDESDFCEREQVEANEAWLSCYDNKERLEYIREYRDQFDFIDFSDLMSVVRGEYFTGYASELIQP